MPRCGFSNHWIHYCLVNKKTDFLNSLNAGYSHFSNSIDISIDSVKKSMKFMRNLKNYIGEEICLFSLDSFLVFVQNFL